MSRPEIRTPEHFFSEMSDATRERLYAEFRNYVWRHATATAYGLNADGERIMSAMTPTTGRLISQAGLEVFVGKGEL